MWITTVEENPVLQFLQVAAREGLAELRVRYVGLAPQVEHR
jgi:hypothetical protein